MFSAGRLLIIEGIGKRKVLILECAASGPCRVQDGDIRISDMDETTIL